ncbi:MAG: hypothetical protein KGJ13_13255 [Patescibacteria group bacterium]|nr:hypothetical protein [Patescibacteria group bacterium]
MARRKQSDDSFVWLLLFGAAGYGIYVWLKGMNTTGTTATNTPAQTSGSPLQFEGGASNVGSVNLPPPPSGNSLEAATP